MSGPVIGIDLGTTYSCVGVWKNNTVEIISNDQGNRTTPSVVAFTETERLIGEAAKNQAVKNSPNTIFDAKRLIGRKFTDASVKKDMQTWPFKVISGKDDRPYFEVTYKGKIVHFTPEEISAAVLTKMKQTAEAYLGCEVSRAVVTTPAYFSDAQRQATKDAGKIAGLDIIRIINEPTAAAMSYGFNNKSDKELNIITVDLGGGTFDVSLLTVDQGIFEVKATSGNTHLGGTDFDARLIKYCIDDFNKRFKKDLSSNQRALSRLKISCENAKRSLSTATQATIELDSLMDSIDYSITISRAKFEQLCADIFRDLIIPVEQVLRDAKMSKQDIHEVILVGGSTRIPKIQELLKNYFGGKELCKSINPDEAVAAGATVQAALLSDNEFNKNNKIVLLDVCPMSLGIETSGQILTSLIKRNSTVPCKKSQLFSTFVDNQTSVEIKIYEGERVRSTDNHLLGQFHLSGIAPAPRGMPQIEVTFDLDINGILHVSAEDKGTGNKNSIVITNDSGRLSKEEIDKMIIDAEKYADDDKEMKETIEARDKLENYVYALKNTLDNEEVKKKINATEQLSEAMMWLESHTIDNTDKQTFENKYTSVESTFKPLIAQLYQNAPSHSTDYNAHREPIIEEVD